MFDRREMLVLGAAALAAPALTLAQQPQRIRVRGTLEFKGGILEGQALTVDEIRSIARLPARDVLHAQVVGVVASPLTGLVRGLNALIAGIAVQLRQIHDQGMLGEPEAPAEAGDETDNEA